MEQLAPIARGGPPPFAADLQRLGRSSRRHLACHAQLAGDCGVPSSRREALALGAALLLVAPGAAADEAAADVAALDAPLPLVDPSTWPQFVDFTYRFRYPPNWTVMEDAMVSSAPASTNQRWKENPVKADLRPPAGAARLTVVERQASTLKQTLTQASARGAVIDITGLGSQAEVAALLFPPGARLLAAGAQAYALPPRDTGTVFGVLQRAPITIFRYEVALPGGTRMAAAAGVQLGRLFVIGGSAPEGDWAAVGPELRAAVASFQLVPKL
eukprot:scaffold28.g7557.t1